MKVGPSEAAAFGGMSLFGIVIALLGAVLPLVSEPLGLDLGATGDLFVALNGAILVGSFGVGLVIDRFGYRGAMVGGPLVIAAALTLVSMAGTPLALAGALALLGLGGSAMNAAPNALVADLYDEARPKAAALNRLGVFYGLGALLLPFLIGALLGRLGLRSLLLVAAGLSVLVSAFSLIPRLPPAKHADGLGLSGALGLLRHPLVAVLAALLFGQAGNEMLLGGYLTTFLIHETGTSVQTASWVLSGYWVALMAGRLLLGRVLLLASASALLPLMTSGAALTLALVTVSSGLPATAALFIGASFCLSGIFPTALAVAGSALPERSGTLFGLIFSLAVIGGMTVPWIAGHLAAAEGLRAIPILGAGVYVVVTMLALWARRLNRRSSERPTAPRATVLDVR